MASPNLVKTGSSPDQPRFKSIKAEVDPVVNGSSPVEPGSSSGNNGLDQSLLGLDQSLDRSESSDSDPMTQYTLEEVTQHNLEGDQWIIFKGRVYDVSSFKHPGGPEAIQRNSGTEATQKILAVEKHQKKLDRIQLMMSEFEIGRVVDPSNRTLTKT